MLGPHNKCVTALLWMAIASTTTIVAAADKPVSAPVGSSPAAWLRAAEKSDQWKAATLRCRGLLGKLNLRDALVQKHLAKVKEKVQLLVRSPDFDWKGKTGVEHLENMLEDLIAGREPHSRYAGKEFAYPYWSKTMERIEAIWVHVPREYDPAKRYQFFMYYKCGGGIHLKDGRVTGGYRPTIEVANRTDSFHAWSSLDIQVKGRKGAHIELAEATAALCRDFSVDPDRIFLTGWSDGGFTAIWLASRYPHLVAGIAPACGNWQYGNVENVGLSNLPTLAVDGWGDGGYNSSQFCRWLALRGLGADAKCIWGHHGHSYQPYEDVEEFQFIMDWAKGKRRDLYPKKVRYATWNLSWNRAYWLAIDRVENPALAAQFEAEVSEDNRIRVQVWNVAAYRLALSDKLVDPHKPLTVTTNGKPSYSGPLKADLLVEVLPRPAGKFVKDASLPDDIAAAIIESSYATKGSSAIPSRRWLAVRPTGLDERTAGLLAQWLPRDAKADVDVSGQDLAACNLLIYGGPDINKLAARIAADLPVKLERGKFTLEGKVYDRPTHCVAFLHPNPLNPKKYVIGYAFNDAETFARHGFLGMTGGSLSEFRTGDCLVSGIPAERRRWGAAMGGRSFESRHLMFDATWKVDASRPLGQLERPFDYPQILRLKADAVREAAGADVGVIWEHTPPWNRWGESLPAGPVTLNDLATIDMFPENIGVAEMRGAELLHGKPSASTIVADRRDGAYDGKTHPAAGEIDPAKTYRVATGYFGMPSYGAEPGRMPKLFPFALPQDFLAVQSNRMPLKNFRQLPTQVIEATAQYIRRHGKVAPRPVCFDLTEYIISPEDNDYGACDWLHLGIDAPWKGAPGRSSDRYTLNLGLRLLDEPQTAPPRGNSKHFLDLGEKLSSRTTFSFAALDKRLPVAVSVVSHQHAITSKEPSGFHLAGADATENAAGQCLLVTVKLANAGPKDLAVTAVLSASELRQVWRQTWPDEEDKDSGGYYAGYHRTRGEDRQVPAHEDGALLLFAAAMPKTTRLVAPNAGYNFGLAGLSAPLALKAGQTLSLPLLLVAVDRPRGRDVSLAQILDTLKADLMRNYE
jgi:pimeloyl-ACP methyl ester carboxylesterase